MTSDNARLPLHIRIGWGIGSLPISILMFVVNTFFLRFATDYVGLSAAVAGGLLAVTKLFDAVASPVVGIASDHTTPRFGGRRRPYLFVGILLCGASLLMMFWVPAGLGLEAASGFIFLALILLSVGYAAYIVPYLAMPAEMTNSAVERAELISYRVYALAAAQFIAGGLAPFLLQHFGGDRAAFGAMAGVMGALIGALGLSCFFLTRNAPATVMATAARNRYWSALPSIAKNRRYVGLVLTKCTLLVGSNAHTATTAFYVLYIMKADNAVLGGFLLAHSLGMVFSQPLWLRVTKIIGKFKIYLVGAGLYTLVSICYWLLGPSTPVYVFIAISAFNGIGAGGALMATESSLPDTIVEDYRMSKIHREGALTAIWTFMEKVGFAIGVATVGATLAWYGYSAPAKGEAISAQAAEGIRIGFGLLPATFVALSCALLYFISMRARPLSVADDGALPPAAAEAEPTK